MENVERIIVGNKELFLCNNHNYVLNPWSEISNAIKEPLILITFDYHTDTNEPDKKEILNTKVEKIKNDEHIKLALYKNIISKAIIFCYGGQSEIEKNIFVCGLEDDIFKNNMQIDNDTLTEKFILFYNKFGIIIPDIIMNQNYILDIDLDYFLTNKSIECSTNSLFKLLLKNAQIITIATETLPYVNDARQALQIDGTDSVDNNYILGKIKCLISEIKF